MTHEQQSAEEEKEKVLAFLYKHALVYGLFPSERSKYASKVISELADMIANNKHHEKQ